MYDAFISYSRHDLLAVQDLKRQLDKRRLRIFIDLESLRAGHVWPRQLGAAVQNSRIMVLCWSAQAAASDWVKAEIYHSLSTRKSVSVLPWLLDDTPLPPMLQDRYALRGDPALIVNAVVGERRRDTRRQIFRLLLSTAVVTPALWILPQVFRSHTVNFRGHITDEEGNAVAGVTVEAEGVRADTNRNGEFGLILPGPDSVRALRVTAWKSGYQRQTINTQSDVPDLGIVIEKER